MQKRRSGEIVSTDAEKFYDILVHSLASITAQYWGLPLHTIAMLLSTLEVMTFFLRTGFGYFYIIYGGKKQQSLSKTVPSERRWAGIMDTHNQLNHKASPKKRPLNYS